MTLLNFAIHPGEILDEEFLKPLDLSAGALAKRLNVPRTRIERLVKGETSLTADTALRLSAFFSNTPEFWLNLQRAYDLAQASKSVDVSHIQPLVAA
ncbi:HigA family addiction module antitoxin [Rhizobium sp.]|jgi:antitoxin HigA-1|uniref:HigA family addiction module antitoxin n=1 Tax=Rhizobium sp. TaxID=391 RepID=UPI000E92B761|nr:addiction module antidote protein, HigA family [Rhizobium sp.]